ncbi:MAG: thermonuclease family protein [Chloroflexota bacterium]|nr:thermonuclease family protein [Chloroflexota bacterium]
MYEYKCTILRHIDADTSRCEIDVGFDITAKLTIRWEGIDAPEMSTEDGNVAKAALLEKLPEGSVCTLRTTKLRKEKYGRYVGTFISKDGINVNDWLVKEGFAKLYPSVTKEDNA